MQINKLCQVYILRLHSKKIRHAEICNNYNSFLYLWSAKGYSWRYHEYAFISRNSPKISISSSSSREYTRYLTSFDRIGDTFTIVNFVRPRSPAHRCFSPTICVSEKSWNYKYKLPTRSKQSITFFLSDVKCSTVLANMFKISLVYQFFVVLKILNFVGHPIH